MTALPRRAYSITCMLAEINRHAPNRSDASDGWIGDAAHAARDSDHNPNSSGVVRAQDITDDPAGGLDGSELAHLIVGRFGKHPALMSGAYVIHNGRICSFDRRDEGWRPYTGTNAHKQHVHVSVSTARAGYDSTQPWDLFEPRRPAKPTDPLALVRLRNQWTIGRDVDWDAFDLLISRGQQPEAREAKKARDKIAATMRDFLRATS